MAYSYPDIVEGVKTVIAINSRYAVSEIGLKDQLEKFITSFSKGILSRSLKRKFEKLEDSNIHNELYQTLKTVENVVDYTCRFYGVSKPVAPVA